MAGWHPIRRLRRTRPGAPNYVPLPASFLPPPHFPLFPLSSLPRSRFWLTDLVSTFQGFASNDTLVFFDVGGNEVSGADMRRIADKLDDNMARAKEAQGKMREAREKQNAEDSERKRVSDEEQKQQEVAAWMEEQKEKRADERRQEKEEERAALKAEAERKAEEERLAKEAKEKEEAAKKGGKKGKKGKKK